MACETGRYQGDLDHGVPWLTQNRGNVNHRGEGVHQCIPFRWVTLWDSQPPRTFLAPETGCCQNLQTQLWSLAMEFDYKAVPTGKVAYYCLQLRVVACWRHRSTSSCGSTFSPSLCGPSLKVGGKGGSASRRPVACRLRVFITKLPVHQWH